MYGLSIFVHSFNLNPSIYNPNDNIRVSITTVPESNKNNFMIKASKMLDAQYFLTVNISSLTKKIIFVFRKIKENNDDPIIASTIVHSNEFPKLNSAVNTEMKTVKLFEPLCDLQPNEKRRIFGQMQIQMLPTDAIDVPLFDETYKTNNNFLKHSLKHHQKKPFKRDENQNVIFDDNYIFN